MTWMTIEEVEVETEGARGEFLYLSFLVERLIDRKGIGSDLRKSEGDLIGQEGWYLA